MALPWIIRPASQQDAFSVNLLLQTAEVKHRHLDWRQPRDWLAFSPFWVIEADGHLRALLAIPADPPHIAWVRLFASSTHPSPRQSWNVLFERCLAELPPRSQTTIAALGLSPWFCGFLEDSGFVLRQKIIILAWDFVLPPLRRLPSGLLIRPMQTTDLDEVHHIDSMAFEPIWQNSAADVAIAHKTAGFSTVAEMDGRVVGYQISTVNQKHLHLTRLAVNPSVQRLSIGFGIVYHLLQHCQKESFIGLTVNTQDDNLASQNLYHQCNFQRTGEFFPVYIYP